MRQIERLDTARKRHTAKMNDREALAMAIKEAETGYEEGGIPVCSFEWLSGAVLTDKIGAILLSHDGKVLGRGRNMRYVRRDMYVKVVDCIQSAERKRNSPCELAICSPRGIEPVRMLQTLHLNFT